METITLQIGKGSLKQTTVEEIKRHLRKKRSVKLKILQNIKAERETIVAQAKEQITLRNVPLQFRRIGNTLTIKRKE